MHDSKIQGFRDLFGDLVLLQQIVDQLRCGAGIRNNMIDIRKSLIAHMMVDADRLLGLFKQCSCKSKSSCIPAVQCEEYIVSGIFRELVADLVRPCQHMEGIGNLFQIHIRADFRIIQTQILVKRQAGPGTVAVRPYMSPQCRPALLLSVLHPVSA